MQKFEPANPIKTKSVTLRLPPTEWLNDVNKAFLVRVLVVERVRCFMEGTDFEEGRKSLIIKHTKIPVHYESEDARARYLNSEIIEMTSCYDRYEQDPMLKADFDALRPYKGHKWNIDAVTEHAVMISVEV